MKTDLPFIVQRRLHQLGVDFLEALDATFGCLEIGQRTYAFVSHFHSGEGVCCMSGFEQIKTKHSVCLYTIMNEEHNLYMDRSFLFAGDWSNDPLESAARLKCYLMGDKRAMLIGYDFLMGNTQEEPKFLGNQTQQSMLAWFRQQLESFNESVKIEKGVVRMKL